MPISATKPAQAVVWATTGGTRTTPSGGQRASGWTSGQRPPYNIMNWLQGFQCDWIKYYEDATDELDDTKLERDGSNTVTGDISPDADNTHAIGNIGSAFGSGTFTNIVVSNIAAIDGVSIDLLDRLQPGSDLGAALGSASRRFSSVNASIGSFTDVVISDHAIPDVEGRDIGIDGFRFDAFLRDCEISRDLTPKADDSASQQLGSAAKRFRAHLSQAAVNDLLMQSAPVNGTEADDQGRTNELVRQNIPKAYGTISTDGSGNVSLVHGFNVSVVPTLVGSSPKAVQISIVSDMANGQYAVPTSYTGTLNTRQVRVSEASKGAGTFQVRLVDGTSDIGFDTEAASFDFVVFGKQ